MTVQNTQYRAQAPVIEGFGTSTGIALISSCITHDAVMSLDVACSVMSNVYDAIVIGADERQCIVAFDV